MPVQHPRSPENSLPHPANAYPGDSPKGARQVLAYLLGAGPSAPRCCCRSPTPLSPGSSPLLHRIFTRPGIGKPAESGYSLFSHASSRNPGDPPRGHDRPKKISSVFSRNFAKIAGIRQRRVPGLDSAQPATWRRVVRGQKSYWNVRRETDLRETSRCKSRERKTIHGTTHN